MRGMALAWLALLGAGCGSPGPAENPEQMAAELFAAASRAAEAGSLGESAELLGRLIAQYPAAAVAAEAAVMRAEVFAQSEAAALRAMRAIAAAQAEFVGLERRYALELPELVNRGLLEPPPDDAGYQIRMRSSPAADAFTATAEPRDGAAGLRSFFVDGSGRVRGETGGPATADSAVVE